MNVCEVSLADDEYVNKKKSRKTSDLWNYFTAISREHAVCDLCQQKFSYKTSTSNLRKHIYCKHKDKKLRKEERKQASEKSLSHLLLPSESLEETPERINFKKDNSRKTELCRNDMSNFLTFKKNSWDRGKESDEYDAFGITVAAKLRKMDERQRLFCERIINDALFKGALDQLTPLSDIVICISATSS